jgi:hypothetical protein
MSRKLTLIGRVGGFAVAVLVAGFAAGPALAFFPQSQPPFPPVAVNPDPPIIVPDPPPPPPPPPPPVNQTPEPATIALAAIGAGVAYVAKRRKKQDQPSS